MIGREQIAEMIPHAGSMCLIDTVLSWSPAEIRCVSHHQGLGDNPLRRADGFLGAACGIEIAAQAMAIHGYLVASGPGRPAQGYLASLRDVRLHAARLDCIDGGLQVDAKLLMGDTSCAVYQFSLSNGGSELVSGRATVLLEIAKK